MNLCLCLVEYCQTSGDFIALSPKTYIAQDDQGYAKQSQKGVPSHTKSSLDEYFACLYDNKIVQVDTCQLMMKKNKMTRVCSQKKALNNKFQKFDLDRDGIIALPLKLDSHCL